MRLSKEASNASRFINLKYGMSGFGIHRDEIQVFRFMTDKNTNIIVGILNIDGTLSICDMFSDEYMCKISILDAEDIFQLYKYDYLASVHREEQIPQAIKDSKTYLVAPFIKRWVQQIYDEYGFKCEE